MTNIPKRCKDCVFVQYDMSSDEYHCYNPCCAMMDTCKDGRCGYHITENDLRDYYKGRSSSEKTTSSWARATPCKFMDENCGVCLCCNLVASVKRSQNNEHYIFNCPFIGSWCEARVVCMGYEAKVQRFEVQMRAGNGPSILGIFDTRERAEKFIKDRIEIVEID